MPNSPHLDLLARAFGRGVFPHQLSWILDLPGRGVIMSASTVAGRLPVGSDAHLLEVGPGSGYYSVEAAKRVPHGRLTLLDVQPGMLEKCARRLDAAGIDNYVTVVSDGSEMPFDDQSFDAVFLVTVLGEITAQEAFIAEAFRVLKPGGVLSVTEHHPDPDFEPASVVAETLARHGFCPTPPIGWRWAYTLNATKPAPTQRRRAGCVAGALGIS